jgi:NAD(P)H-hydrate epimerase
MQLTHEPSSVARADLEPLHAHGLDDRAIVDLNQVVAYFNYANRIADGLGVELEERWADEIRAHRNYQLADTSPRFPILPASALPWLTVEQMREVDRMMVEDLHIDLPRMMENAGRGLAELARFLMGGNLKGKRVVVLAGTGGNGGGGLVAARHLANAGAQVNVAMAAAQDRPAPVTDQQFEILSALGVTVGDSPGDADNADLVIDALLGYSQKGPPRKRTARLVAWALGRRAVALDVPSGLELSTGTLHEPHVSAEATLTLALPKHGLLVAPEAVGRLFLADISVPPAVYRRLGLPFTSPFSAGPIVRLRAD